MLVVNADDFGRSPNINRGIIESHENGIVTSASLMVHWPAATEAANYARENPALGVGLHLDLGEWEYSDDSWSPVYVRASLDDAERVAGEIETQLALFRELVGRHPSHLDSHQHVHLRDEILPLVVDMAKRLSIPLRSRTTGIQYCGDFYGQTGEGQPLAHAVSLQSLLSVLSAMPDGINELACHPGYAIDLETDYREERAQEVRALCDPATASAVRDLAITLISFNDLAASGWTPEFTSTARLSSS